MVLPPPTWVEMGHFTRFWGQWHYPQSCSTRPAAGLAHVALGPPRGAAGDHHGYGAAQRERLPGGPIGRAARATTGGARPSADAAARAAHAEVHISRACPARPHGVRTSRPTLPTATASPVCVRGPSREAATLREGRR